MLRNNINTRGHEYSNKFVKQIRGIKMIDMVVNARNIELRALIFFFFFYMYNDFK